MDLHQSIVVFLTCGMWTLLAYIPVHGVSAGDQPIEPGDTTLVVNEEPTSDDTNTPPIELIEGDPGHKHELDLVTAEKIVNRREPDTDPTFDLKPDRYVVRVKLEDDSKAISPASNTVDIADGFPNLFSEDFTLRSPTDLTLFSRLVDAEPITITPVLIFDRAAPSISEMIPMNTGAILEDSP